MDPLTLTFARRGALLTLRRERSAEGVALVAVESGRPRTFLFTDPGCLAQFQHDMEEFLLRTGWSRVDGPAQQVAAAPKPAAVGERAASGLRLTLAEEEVGTRS